MSGQGGHTMRTVRIAAAQTPEFREDLHAALSWAEAAIGQAEAEDAVLLLPRSRLTVAELRSQSSPNLSRKRERSRSLLTLSLWERGPC